MRRLRSSSWFSRDCAVAARAEAAALCRRESASLLLQLAIQRVEGRVGAVERAGTAGRAVLGAGFLALEVFREVAHLVLDAHHVRVLVGVGHQQLVALVLQFAQAAADLAGAGLHQADLILARQLALDGARLRAHVDHVHARTFDLPAQFADAGIDVGIDARARVGVLAAVLLQLAFGLGQLGVVLADLRVDELVGVAAFALLGRQALADHQVGEAAGDVVGALGVGIDVLDLDQVLARIGDLRALGDLFLELFLRQRRRVGCPASRRTSGCRS